MGPDAARDTVMAQRDCRERITFGRLVEWDDRFLTPFPKNLSCSECGATMGREVKLLLDHDLCPFCEEGKVSLTAPVCAKCGQRIDPGTVVWG
jgi:hypothetical protein